MKKIILIALIGFNTAAFAQTKKSIVKPVVASMPDVDTVIHIQTYTDMSKRVQAMQDLKYIIMKPGDVTPNQTNRALFFADSLIKVDAAQYNKIEAIKAKNKPKK